MILWSEGCSGTPAFWGLSLVLPQRRASKLLALGASDFVRDTSRQRNNRDRTLACICLVHRQA